MKPKMMSLYMDICVRIAQMSVAERAKVGALIVKNNNILSFGWNGTPNGWDNCCEDHLTSYDARDANNPLDSRPWTYDPDTKKYHALKSKPEVLHAETNAIAKVARSPESAEGATMFCTHLPCIDCAKLIYQSGIGTVYYKHEYLAAKGSGKQFLLASGVEVIQYPGVNYEN